MEKRTLETKNCSIEFPGVKALDSVDFSVSTGETRAVVGANGAGKSTLMKIFAGVNPNYTGQVLLDGRVQDLRRPIDAKRLGIEIVHQEVDEALYNTLSVAENIFQSDMIIGKSSFVVNWPKVFKEGRKALDRLNISRDTIHERELVGNLTLAQKQMVLIAKAIRSECNFLILDEPTAALSDTETKVLFDLIRNLQKNENISIIFITHRLYEIIEICNSYTVMRNGKIIKTAPITNDTDINDIVELMLGRTFEKDMDKQKVPIGEVALMVKNLSSEESRLKDISFNVCKGEIIGIAGLVGAGKSELCKTLFGAHKIDSGTVELNGKKIKIKSPANAVKNSIALVPEERRKEGLLVNEDVSFNLSLVSLPYFSRFSFINRKKVKANAIKYIDDLDIATPSHNQLARFLSGGNQQKVAIGKWLSADCDFYIFDEPTKGVDVGAKRDLYHLIKDIAKNGHGIIFASQENAELLTLTDRIYVMYDGTITAELKTSETSEDEIMRYAVGKRQNKLNA